MRRPLVVTDVSEVTSATTFSLEDATLFSLTNFWSSQALLPSEVLNLCLPWLISLKVAGSRLEEIIKLYKLTNPSGIYLVSNRTEYQRERERVRQTENLTAIL
jgi:hypothetical protein